VRISLTERTQVAVRLEFVGEPTAVKMGDAAIEAHLHEITVECLPRDIPSSLHVDISNLEVGDHITVGQIPVDADAMTIITDHEHLVLALVAARGAEADETAEATPEAPAAG